jgi:CheY-like chemotaxis protein
MKHLTLLCVDDDPRIRELYEALLGSHGYEVLVASSGRQALKLFHSNQEIDAVISDYEMPGMNGVELAAELKLFDPTIPVIMVSGYDLPTDTMTPFVDAAVAKGAPVERLLDCIESLLGISVSPETGIPSANYASLGSTLIGLATAGFFLMRV